MVEVFKTNITLPEDANRVMQQLLSHLEGARINMDLQDCDRILRIESSSIPVHTIQRAVNQMGFDCEALE